MSFADIESARKRLRNAQLATARFTADHKDRKWSNEETAHHRSLITAELNASIQLSYALLESKEYRRSER
jgi:hypothetical protein